MGYPRIWDGVPPGPGMGYPPRPGTRYPPPTWDWVPPHPTWDWVPPHLTWDWIHPQTWDRELPPPPPQHSEHLLRGGWYASCIFKQEDFLVTKYIGGSQQHRDVRLLHQFLSFHAFFGKKFQKIGWRPSFGFRYSPRQGNPGSATEVFGYFEEPLERVPLETVKGSRNRTTSLPVKFPCTQKMPSSSFQGYFANF